MVDSVMVVTVTFGAVFYRGEMAFETLMLLVGSNYAFKAIAALIDTVPLYLLVHWLRSFLALGPDEYAVGVTNPATAV